jgi:hypothetical protein
MFAFMFHLFILQVTEEFIRDWFKGLVKFLLSQKALDILKQPLRFFNGDEVGFQLEPQPKSVKLIVPKGIDDVFMVKHKSSKKSVTVRHKNIIKGTLIINVTFI